MGGKNSSHVNYIILLKLVRGIGGGLLLLHVFLCVTFGTSAECVTKSYRDATHCCCVEL